ncbi:glycoside hydrolase family 99-like domain-containing protein [Planktothrix agardhii]|uniref:glycoside hydrolase family 99-like domain-containing protein n=1 Tax=Planktothrix agardhii TaxID=1160 RepID=UPI0020A836AF|nr:glycoside hydrolase family 99-like domain-containing protein [Planktothrix agardhii]CAD5946408.1 hypothetical protein NO365_02263 [Planktothrix agardhii]
MVIQQRPSSFSDRPQVSSMVKSRRRSVSQAEPHYRLAQALVKQEKWQEAIAAYQQALIITPNWVEVQRELGDLFLKLERWDEAVQVYETAIGLRSEGAEVYHNLGDALLKLQRWEDAIAAYQKAIELNPEFSWSYNNLGDGLRELQRWDEAAQSYQKAIELKPDFALSHHNLGDVLVKKENWERAIAAYQKAVDLDPNFVWSYYNLAEVYVKLDQWDEAVEAYRQVLKIKPDLTEVEEKLNRALHQQVKTRLETALSYYRKAIKNDPTDVESYQKALEIKPDDAELYFGLGNAWIAKGEEEKAIAVYESAIRINPGLNEAKFKLEQLLKQTISQQSVKGCEQEEIKEEALTTNIAQVTSDIIVNSQTTDVRLITFYLPQYHPIPENDEWWGKGFTEWTNVTKAQPLFEGHYQPHLPADLGFYDLRLPEVREAQAQLARQYGIYGFCYYYYWFAGKRLLDRPLDEMLESKKPDFPFCLCWANENWSRRWDGSENEILIAQDHSEENDRAFAESVIPYLLDERYIRINGKPLLIIYRANILPEVTKTIQHWREVFRKHGVGEVYLCAALTFGLEDAISLGFDSEVEFPPHRNFTQPIPPEELGISNFSGKIYDYRELVRQAITASIPEKIRFLTCMLSWDNTARKGENAHIHYHFSLELYQSWLQANIEKTKINYSGDERLTFINAWNEWSEGTHLEPDQKYGHDYLITTRNAVLADCSWQMVIQLLFSYRGQNSLKSEKLLLELYTKIVQEKPSFKEITEELEKTKVFRIESITYENNLSETFWYLESCQQGQYYYNSINITGWLLDKKLKPVIIEVSQNDRLIQQIRINYFREDVFNAYPEFKNFNNNFEGIINTTSLNSKNNFIDLEFRVLYENSTFSRIGSLRLKSIIYILESENQSSQTLQIIKSLKTYLVKTKPLLFILHDIFPAGAQLFLINLLDWITKTYPEMNIEVLINLHKSQICVYGGLDGQLGKNVFERLEKICPVYFLDQETQLPENLDNIQNNGYSLIYVNTSVLGDLLESIGQINTPVIVHIHELYFWIKYRLGIDKFNKYLKYNPKFIACGNAVKNNLVNNFNINPEQIEVIHDYVPVEKLIQSKTKTREEIRQELNLSEDTFVIASCGTLDWRKGADLLVALVVLLKEKLPSKKFVYLWIGSFPTELSESEMDFTIKKAGLEQDIILVGHQTNPMNYLNASDVFVLLSKEDPFPLVMSEGAVCKLAMVGFDGSGGVSEFVESDAGLLAPYLNLAAMAEKIAILYDNPNLRKEMGENAYRKVNELYNETVLAPKVMQLIQSLIQQSSQSNVGV